MAVHYYFCSSPPRFIPFIFVVFRLQNNVAYAQIQEFPTISDYNISLARLARLKGML